MTSDPRHLLLLLAWMSPGFPTGAFAYSHGLESAIAGGVVATAGDTTTWISDLVARGSGWNDAVLFARCWQDDPSHINELALALCVSRERHLETTQLGRSFLLAASVFAPEAAQRQNMVTAYPVAAGTCCRAMGIPCGVALVAYLQGFCAALISVAVRLVPLGQTQGLVVMRDLMAVIAEIAARAAHADLSDLGSIAIMSDIAAMRHETQQPRIFRT